MDDDKLQMGFTSPLWRDGWSTSYPQPKRRPIGFVHFGEPDRSRARVRDLE
jgi:hypothetical protein